MEKVPRNLHWFIVIIISWIYNYFQSKFCAKFILSALLTSTETIKLTKISTILMLCPGTLSFLMIDGWSLETVLLHIGGLVIHNRLGQEKIIFLTPYSLPKMTHEFEQQPHRNNPRVRPTSLTHKLEPRVWPMEMTHENDLQV